MDIEHNADDANRAQKLIGHLTIDQLTAALFAGLCEMADEYMALTPDSTPSLRFQVSRQLFTAAYHLSLKFDGDHFFYAHFDGTAHQLKETERASNIPKTFELMLLYAFQRNSRRWTKRANRIAMRFEQLSEAGLDSNQIVLVLGIFFSK